MDDYLNIYEYVGDDHEQQEYSTATNVNKEEHEMVKITPQEVHQPTQINQRSTDTRETQDQKNIRNVPKATKRCTILMSVLIAVILLISLAAIVLSAVLYNVPNSEKTDLRAQGANTFNAFIKDMEFTLMQLNNTLLQLKSEQNMIHHSVIQSKIDINLLISQFMDNISKLSIQLDEVNNDVKSVATTVNNNISQLFTQLDAANNGIMSVTTTVESNISQLHVQLDAINTLSIIVLTKITRSHCGAGEWHRVAYLNMSDPSQQCPPSWREYNYNQFRTCGRSVSTTGSRSSKSYSTNRQYSKVCGRVIGIQVASPDAFHAGQSINYGYVDGVSITYGSPRKHIWSFAGSYSEIGNNTNALCPCDNRYSSITQPPLFVGNNYYCESGNPTQNWRGQNFPNDKLWDGEQCSSEGTCCTGTNTLPWFTVNLESPTSDDIEVRIIGTESTTNEDTPIELLEIYVQ